MADAKPSVSFNQVIGTPGTFEPGMDVTIFESKLTNFFLANGIENEVQKKSILLSAVSEEIHKILFSLCVPNTPDSQSYSTLFKLLNQYYKPVKSYFAARHTFYMAKQRTDETVAEWGARVKNLASKCKFSSELCTVIRDIFVVGMSPGKIQDRLIEEDPSDLKITFTYLMEIANIKEATIREKNAWKSNESDLNYQKQLHQNKQVNRQPSDRQKCAVCGRSNHLQRNCRYKDYSCNICNSKGHLAPVCKNGKNFKQNYDNRSYTKFLTESSSNNVDDQEVTYNLSDTFFNLIEKNSQNRVKPFTVNLLIENLDVKFEIDTGSLHSVMSKKMYLTLFSRITLLDNDISLSDYIGNNISPVGKIEVNAKYVNNEFKMCIYVIEKGGPPLIGRNDLQKINYSPIYNNVEEDNNLNNILNSYEDLFKDEIGTFNKYEISLNVKKESSPKFFKPRSIPLALKNKVETEIDRLVKSKILIPLNYSEWATPIVPILKSDGTVRICGDFKITINPVLEGTEYPLPKIEHLYANISGSKYFSKIDLKDAYQQMVIKDSDRKYTTINTHKGLFCYTRSPFGIKSSAGEFQKAMEISTAGINGVGVFQDDIIVAGRTIQEHNDRLDKLLSVLHNCGLRVKLKKCKFLQKSIEYLGHRIDENGLHTLTKHIDAIRNAAVPENKSTLKSFLGLVTYYLKFIPNAAEILKPLYSLLRNDTKWHWSSNCDDAYKKIKQILISRPTLAHYDQNLPLKLIVDSSSYALGAVLSHVYPDNSEKPVAFASRILSDAECKFPQIEKEGLAIIFGIQKFYDFLYARKFTLISDHKPLIHIFGDKKGIPIYAANRLQRWAYVLSSFDFDIKYINSEKNIADFLSRIKINHSNSNMGDDFDNIHLNFIHENSPFPLNWSKIKIETNRDKIMARVLHATKTGEWNDDPALNNDLKPYANRKNEISCEQGCLLWGYRVIIPQKFQQNILAELHSCHIGMTSMKSLARSYFWWPTIDNDIENMVRDCHECTNARPNPPKSIITPWRWPQRPWTRVHCDYLGPYKGKIFLIFVDATSKWLEVFPVNSMTAQTVITKFSELIARFGIPRTITTDGAKCFTGIEFENYCKKLGIRHLRGAPFHPASNGCAESGVKIVKQFFKKCSFSINQLNKFLLMHRNTPHTTTHETPAKLMLGHSTRTIFDLLIPSTNDVVVDSQISQIKYGGNRNINVKEGDCVLVKDYRNKGENWQKATVTENISDKTHKVTLDEGPTWIRHDDQMWPVNKTDGSLSPAGNNNNETDKNDHAESTATLSNNILIKSPRPVRIKKPIQRFSPSDYK